VSFKKESFLLWRYTAGCRQVDGKEEDLPNIGPVSDLGICGRLEVCCELRRLKKEGKKPWRGVW
jgi:hypothetical protein